jgi:protein-tyrosine phosphatase
MREFRSAPAITCEAMTREPDVEKFSVLFVCLGNICRSPTAAGVFRQVAAEEAPQLDIRVDSAGTSDYHIGNPPDERSVRAALGRGIDLRASRARQVTARDFERFDLVLAMDRRNLRDLRALQPGASRAELRLFLEFAAEAEDLEVPDPYYGGPDGFERVLDLAMRASRGLIAQLLRGQGVERPRG